MPFWKIYHSPNTLTQEDKSTLSASITEYYVSVGLPAYYVNIFYLPLPSSDFYVGGKPESKKLSIEILHIARQWDSTEPARATYFKNSINNILKPYTTDKGVQLEFCVVQGPPQLWRINGIDPPEGLGQKQEEEIEKNRELLEESVKKFDE
jgi:phenylpyruvate tautomerase PptA (4-oxalocrotonate tautomerase family)